MSTERWPVWAMIAGEAAGWYNRGRRWPMVAHPSRPSWTVEQYFEMERTSPVRHEYIDGAVYALAGGTRAHGRLTANLAGLLYVALGDGPCQTYSSDVRVQVTPARYVYPDLS